ncbi:MAG: DUF5700 domain-containing putative Zn-dependent protease [Candidatus Fimadaptatus sp.]
MKLSLHSDFCELLLHSRDDGGMCSRQLCQHPAFQAAKRHAQDFNRTSFTNEDYLDELLHINGFDILARGSELRRNIECIRRTDLEKVVSQVAHYLPAECIKAQSVHIHLLPGIGGLALDGMILLDPAPCPWYPCDGSDAGRYLEQFILPTMRHELHHVCYRTLRKDVAISDIKTKKLLAEDYLLQLQMEGSAVMCESLCRKPYIASDENIALNAMLKSSFSQVIAWLDSPNGAIDADDWTKYYALWGENKLAYLLGEFAFKKMLKRDIPVSEAIRMSPMEWFEKVKACI